MQNAEFGMRNKWSGFVIRGSWFVPVHVFSGILQSWLLSQCLVLLTSFMLALFFCVSLSAPVGSATLFRAWMFCLLDFVSHIISLQQSRHWGELQHIRWFIWYEQMCTSDGRTSRRTSAQRAGVATALARTLVSKKIYETLENKSSSVMKPRASAKGIILFRKFLNWLIRNWRRNASRAISLRVFPDCLLAFVSIFSRSLSNRMVSDEVFI